MSPRDGAGSDKGSISSAAAETAQNGLQIKGGDEEEGGTELSLTPGQKRLRDEEGEEGSQSDDRSPAGTESPRSAKRTKRARVSLSRSNSSPSSHHGSEEGEIEDSDSENPREALERGKVPMSTANDPARSVPATLAVETTKSLTTDSNPEKEEDVGEAEGFESAVMPPNPPSYVHGSLTLLLPTLSEKKTGSWFLRCKDWVRVLCLNNVAHVKEINPKVALAAYTFYIEEHSGLKSGKKRSAKQAAKKREMTRAFQKEIDQATHNSKQVQAATAESRAEEGPLDRVERGAELAAAQSDNAQTLVPATQQDDATLLQPDDKGQDGKLIVNEQLTVSEAELQQQRRYFPSAVDPSKMCLFCGEEGHTAAQCHRSTCAFCGGSGHWDYACNSVPRRCDKCRQLGHDASKCVEKLNLTKDEGLACVYCHSPDHLEAECTSVWRSFRPDAQALKTVVYLPLSCCICGAANHFSGDCAQRTSVPTTPTWTMQNRNRYLDRNSSIYCIHESTASQGPAKSHRPPDAKIRGHASRTANVHYSSDESEPEFLGRRAVPKQRGIGNIRMSSNIQMPQLVTGSQGLNSFKPFAGQPPLPPGPPPPMNGLAPSGPRGYVPPPAPTSLPPRPPARDNRDLPGRGGVSRGDGHDSRRGRGGRGNRGKGRGRGRPRGF